MPNIIKSARTLEFGYYQLPLKSVSYEAIAAANDVLCDEKRGQNDPSAEDEADKIIKDAQQRAQEIISQAQLEAELLKEQAIQKGLAEIEGKREALLGDVQTLLANAQHVREEIIRYAEPQVVELSLQIAKALIKTSLFVEADLIIEIVAEAISLLAGEESIMVKVNPEDLAVCREHKLYFQEQLADDGLIKILPSAAVGKGSCVVQGQYAVVEAFLEERFNILRDALLKEASHDPKKPAA